MKRRDFLKQLGLAASLPWFGQAALAAPAAAAPSASETLRILTCNIRVDVPADAKAGNGWADRKDLCVEVMRAQRADLIGLQECQDVHLQYLKSKLPEYDSFGLSRPDEHHYQFNAILYSRARFQLLSSGGFWLSEKPNVPGSLSWDSAQARFVNWVQLRDRKSGQELRHWNTHFDHIGQRARENSARLIVEASTPLPADLPQLLTGDLNAHAANSAIKTLAAGGWTDTYASIHGAKDPGFTAHAFLGKQRAEKRGNGKPGGKIDWIWCRGPVNPLAAEIIRDSRNGRYPSDHYFVSAVVAI